MNVNRNRFSARRIVKAYAEELYRPAADRTAAVEDRWNVTETGSSPGTVRAL